MEEKLYDALARVLIKGNDDGYGGILQNPLHQAIVKYVETQNDKLVADITRKINLEEMTKTISDKIVEDISRHSSTYNKNYVAENLRAKVMEKLAEMLAKEELEKMKSKG
jgi:hypothetical protein